MDKKRRIWLVVLGVLGLWIALQAVQILRYNRQTESLPDDAIVGQGRPVLLQISSANCGYCRQMLPVLTELANREESDFAVALVSLDKRPAAEDKYGVRAIPMQIFYDGRGNELYRHTGYLSKPEIHDLWRQLGIENL